MGRSVLHASAYHDNNNNNNNDYYDDNDNDNDNDNDSAARDHHHSWRNNIDTADRINRSISNNRALSDNFNRF